MTKRGIDIAVYGCDAGYQYLSGVINGWRFHADMVHPLELLLVPSEGSATLLSSRESVDLQEILREIGGKSDRIRIAVGDRQNASVWTALLEVFPQAEYVAADLLLAPLRLIKDSDEISILRSAAELTDAAVKSALPAIREGVSMRELQLEIEMCGRSMTTTSS